MITVTTGGQKLVGSRRAAVSGDAALGVALSRSSPRRAELPAKWREQTIKFVRWIDIVIGLLLYLMLRVIADPPPFQYYYWTGQELQMDQVSPQRIREGQAGTQSLNRLNDACQPFSNILFSGGSIPDCCGGSATSGILRLYRCIT